MSDGATNKDSQYLYGLEDVSGLQEFQISCWRYDVVPI